MVGTLVTHKYKFKKKRKERIIGLFGTQLHQFLSRLFFFWSDLSWKGDVRWFVRLANPSVTCTSANTMLSCQTALAKQCCTVSETTNLLRRLITILGWTTVWSVQSSANNTKKQNVAKGDKDQLQPGSRVTTTQTPPKTFKGPFWRIQCYCF